ncbi:MAG: glucan biosynthesis glucosyltransferase H [Caulobacterales bacterium 68-7]|nr:MAG: glucan biosynthesis glucosyltransferase H [Caulobacterales bacterium 68-7]
MKRQTPYAALPPEAPLEMPEQAFHGHPLATNAVPTSPAGIFVRRLLLIVATAVIGLMASTSVRVAVGLDGVGLLDVLLLLLFVPLVSWIAFGFVAGCAGFLKLITGEHPGFTPIPRPESALRHKTAVLMPVHNESVEATFGRVEAMARSIADAGAAEFFDFFILSDSNALHGRHEEEAWAQLSARAPIRVYYRRRTQNIGKKPGNVADWIRRFGGAYEHMIVLDADSMMSGSAMVGMASIMETKPTVGLLQTVPNIVGAHTLFQRWMQFATYAYGPIASAGLLWWSGAESNFWGHNAIVRTRAFADCCGLPDLPGKPPFGGLIQSHDMVEAALLRRRGWAVHMVMINGSYEEFPPTVIDHAIRDRRWAQGNLQHLRLLDATGFHWISRLHLLVGASAYMTAPAWLLLLIVQIAQAFLGGSDLLVGGPPPGVLLLTVVCLFGVKVMSVVWLLVDGDRRRGFGGAYSIIRSALLEIVLSILLAPVAMVNHTKALIGLLLGIKSEWSPQSRESEGLTLREVLPKTREHLALGLAFLVAGVFNPVLGLWLSPVILGLLAAPWLITVTSSGRLGTKAHDSGLFIVPPPAIDEEPEFEPATPAPLAVAT